MTTHTGSCHCGGITFAVESDLSERIVCNCSMCGRAGTMLTFVPGAQLTVNTGEDLLTDYQFGKKSINHSFCSVCGIKPFARGDAPDGTAWVGINIGCLDGVDRNELEPTRKYDGKSI